MVRSSEERQAWKGRVCSGLARQARSGTTLLGALLQGVVRQAWSGQAVTGKDVGAWQAWKGQADEGAQRQVWRSKARATWHGQAWPRMAG